VKGQGHPSRSKVKYTASKRRRRGHSVSDKHISCYNIHLTEKELKLKSKHTENKYENEKRIAINSWSFKLYRFPPYHICFEIVYCYEMLKFDANKHTNTQTNRQGKNNMSPTIVVGDIKIVFNQSRYQNSEFSRAGGPCIKILMVF
jgi:hypothetical protein